MEIVVPMRTYMFIVLGVGNNSDINSDGNQQLTMAIALTTADRYT